MFVLAGVLWVGGWGSECLSRGCCGCLRRRIKRRCVCLLNRPTPSLPAIHTTLHLRRISPWGGGVGVPRWTLRATLRKPLPVPPHPRVELGDGTYPLGYCTPSVTVPPQSTCAWYPHRNRAGWYLTGTRVRRRSRQEGGPGRTGDALDGRQPWGAHAQPGTAV